MEEPTSRSQPGITCQTVTPWHKLPCIHDATYRLPRLPVRCPSCSCKVILWPCTRNPALLRSRYADHPICQKALSKLYQSYGGRPWGCRSSQRCTEGTVDPQRQATPQDTLHSAWPPRPATKGRALPPTVSCCAPWPFCAPEPAPSRPVADSSLLCTILRSLLAMAFCCLPRCSP